MRISPLSPTWARWQLQGFQAERRRSSTSIICGDPCHTHTHTHSHTYTRPSSLYAIHIQSHIETAHTNTRARTLPPPHVPCCSSLTIEEQANPEAWQTDRLTDVSLSEPLHQGGLSDDSGAEDHSFQSHDALGILTNAQTPTHSVKPICAFHLTLCYL